MVKTMIECVFYEFAKMRNSTKRPGGGVATPVEIKSTTSILTPSIILKLDGNPQKYNYCYIADFERYYYISNWAWVNGLWQADLQEDYLATWRDNIGASTQYITRASAEYNLAILDNMYPTVGAAQTDTTTAESPFVSSLRQGWYVVGIINADLGGVGAVHYYVFTQAEFNEFCRYLLGNTDWLGIDFTTIDTTTESLLKTTFNPFQYVVSCQWFPVQPAIGAKSSIKYGWWTLGGEYSSTNGTVVKKTVEIPLHKHPQAGAYGQYLNMSPYSDYTLYFEPFGSIPLDSTVLAGISSVTCEVSVDFVSGGGVLDIKSGSDTIYHTHAQIGVPIQLAQMGVDYFGLAQTAIGSAGKITGAAASLAASGASGGATALIGGAMALSAVGDTAQAAMPQMSTSGANGSKVAYSFDPKIVCRHFTVTPKNIDHWGAPLMQKRRIDTIPGFVMCADPDIILPGYPAEQDGVRQWLTNGIYYE